jgi:hypothetical protein
VFSFTTRRPTSSAKELRRGFEEEDVADAPPTEAPLALSMNALGATPLRQLWR